MDFLCLNSKERTNSKYFDLEKYYESVASREGWSKEEFATVIQRLESIPRKALVDLIQEFSIAFERSDTVDIADREELISILLSDVSREKLTEKLGITSVE